MILIKPLLFLLSIIFLSTDASALTVTYMDDESRVESLKEQYEECGVKVFKFEEVKASLAYEWRMIAADNVFTDDKVNVLIVYEHNGYNTNFKHGSFAGARLVTDLTNDHSVVIIGDSFTAPSNQDFDFNLYCRDDSTGADSTDADIAQSQSVFFDAEFANGFVSVPYAQIEGDETMDYAVDMSLQDGKLKIFDLNPVERPKGQTVLATFNAETKLLNIPEVSVGSQLYRVTLKLIDGSTFLIESLEPFEEIEGNYKVGSNINDLYDPDDLEDPNIHMWANIKKNDDEQYLIDRLSYFEDLPSYIVEKNEDYLSWSEDYTYNDYSDTQNKDYKLYIQKHNDPDDPTFYYYDVFSETRVFDEGGIEFQHYTEWFKVYHLNPAQILCIKNQVYPCD